MAAGLPLEKQQRVSLPGSSKKGLDNGFGDHAGLTQKNKEAFLISLQTLLTLTID
jgi:hypothetical protein